MTCPPSAGWQSVCWPASTPEPSPGGRGVRQSRWAWPGLGEISGQQPRLAEPCHPRRIGPARGVPLLLQRRWNRFAEIGDARTNGASGKGPHYREPRSSRGARAAKPLEWFCALRLPMRGLRRMERDVRGRIRRYPPDLRRRLPGVLQAECAPHGIRSRQWRVCAPRGIGVEKCFWTRRRSDGHIFGTRRAHGCSQHGHHAV